MAKIANEETCFGAVLLLLIMLASGSELLFNRGRDHGLPMHGEKLQEPSFTSLEDESLKLKLNEQMHLLKEPRTTRSDQFAYGEYLKFPEMVHVKKECGKFWQYMGVDTDIGKCLYPEEALYLMEAGVMEVENEGVPMSIQQAFSSLLRDDHHIDQYLVFAFFSRLGCKIVKHQPHLCTTRYEKKIRLDQHQIHQKSKKFNFNEANSGSKEVDIEDKIASELLSFYKSISRSSKEVEIQEIGTPGLRLTPKEEHTESEYMSHFQIIKKEILDSFPNFHEAKCLQIRTPPVALLPPNAVPSREEYEIDMERLYWDDSVDNCMENMNYNHAERWRDSRRHQIQWQEQSSGYENWRRNNMNSDWQRKSNCVGWQGRSSQEEWESRNSREGWQKSSHDCWPGNDLSGRWKQNENVDNWQGCNMKEWRGNWNSEEYGNTNTWNWRHDKGEQICDRGDKDCHQNSSQRYQKNIGYINRKPGSLECSQQKGFSRHSKERRNTYGRRNQRWGRGRRDRGGAGEGYPSSLVRVGPHVRTWKEYKEYVSRRSEEELLAQGPAAVLWKGATKPLLKPSMKAIHKTLQDSRVAELFNPEEARFDQMSAKQLVLHYDVYQPSILYKKSRPALPCYRVTVLRSTKQMPTVGQIMELNHRFCDGCPILYCLVLHGEVRIFQMPLLCPNKIENKE